MEGGAGTATEAAVRNPLNAAAARDRAVRAEAHAGARPITSRDAEKVGVHYPHNFDRRRDELRNSRQKPVRQQAVAAPLINDDESIIVSRSDLVHGVSTGESVKHDRLIGESPVKWLGLPIEDRRRLETGEDVLMPAEVVRKNVDFLRNYTKRWNDLARIDAPAGSGAPNMLEHLLQNPDFYADKALLDKLSVIKGPNIRGTVEDTDIRQFLSSSDAWGETMLAIERFSLMAEMGLGMEATMHHKIFNRQRDDSLRHRQIITEQDLKGIRAMTKTGISNSLSSLGALAYFLGGRMTTEMDFRYRAEIVNELKKAPDAGGMSVEDRAVLFAFTGVDLDNLNAAGDDTVPVNDSVTHAQDVEEDVARAYSARKDVMVTLGLGEYPTNGWFTKGRDVDRNRDVRTLHEWIYLEAQGFERGQGGRRPEGLRFVSDVRVMREYTRLLREATTLPPGVAGPLPAPPDELDKLRFMGEALTIVRNRYAQDRVEVETRAHEERQAEDSLQAMDAKQTAMDSGEFRKTRTEALEKRRDDAKKAREALEARRTKLQEGDGSVGKTETAVQTLASKLSRMGVDTTGNVEAAFRAREAVIQGEINTQLAALNVLATNRNNEQQAVLAAARNNYRAAISGLPAGVRNVPPFDGANAEKEAVAERWKPMMDTVQAEVARFQQEMAELRSGYKEYRDATDTQFEATLSLAYDGERNKLQSATDARNALTAAVVTLPGAAAAAALTPVDITGRSSQVLVDALRGTVPPTGADDAERLRWVLQAKAQVEQDNAPLPGYQQTAVARLNTLPAPNNFSRDVLMIRNPEEVITVLRDLYEAGGLPTDPNLPPGPLNPPLAPLPAADALNQARAEVLAARMGVSRQLTELVSARLTAEIDHQRGVERNAEEQLNNSANLEIPKAQVFVARAVMRRMADGSLMSEARSLADIPRAGAGSADDRLVTELGNIGAVDPADNGLTDAERNSGVQQWVLEWYAQLLPSYRDATNRQELFQGLMRDLPPRRLGEIINNEMGAPRVAAGTAGFENVVVRRFRNRARDAARRPTQAQILRIHRAAVAEIRAAGAAV